MAERCAGANELLAGAWVARAGALLAGAEPPPPNEREAPPPNEPPPDERTAGEPPPPPPRPADPRWACAGMEQQIDRTTHSKEARVLIGT
jgi:hypothetical protein